MKRIPSLLIFLLLLPMAQAVVLDLGSYSIENPLITAIYTTDVRLEDAQLIATDPDAPQLQYELVILPSQGFDDTHVMRTEVNGTKHPLNPGNYELTLRARDQSGTVSLDIVNFEITGPAIRLISPRFGIATDHPFNVNFETLENFERVNMACEWSNVGFDTNLQQVDESDDGLHKIFGLDYRGFLYITCSEPSGRETARRFTVGWDGQPPVIQATADPELVRDPRRKETFIVVQTDEDTVCTLDDEPIAGASELDEDDYDTRHETVKRYDDITDDKEHVFDHVIECTNLAGLTSSASVRVTVNLGLGAYIDVLRPKQFTNASTFTLTARPTFVADTCTVNGDAMTRDGQDWKADFSGLQDGPHTFTLFCDGSNNATRDYEVVVDTTGPTMQKLDVPQRSCGGAVTAAYNATDDDKVKSYTWTIFDEEDEVAEDKTTISTKAETFLLSGDYTITVYATDRAGNDGTPVTADFTILPTDNPVCEDLAEGCTLDSDCSITEACVDGLCRESCNLDADCSSGEVCEGNVCVDPGLEGCSADADCSAGQVCEDSVCRDTCSFASDCGSGETCDDGTCKDACTFNSDCSVSEVCDGGVCIPPVSCTFNSDCSAGQVCDNGFCTQGSGSSCISDADCITGEVCDAGTCKPEAEVGEPGLKGGPEEGCSSDVECSIDQVCQAGKCVTRPDSPRPTPIDKPGEDGPFPWLAVVLIVLGVLVMGGSGYYLYEQHLDKTKPEPKKPTGPTGPSKVDIAQQKARQQQKERAMRERKEKAREQREKREKERHETFKKFDEEEKEEDDVFDKLGKLGK